MAKQLIEITDFDLFHEVMKSTVKLVSSAKIMIGPNGLEIYGARDRIARCEITSNAVFSPVDISFSIENMQMFLRIVTTIKEIHNGDYSNLKFFVDLPFIRFESKKFKTKYSTCNEDIIGTWISKKLETVLVPVFEFTSSVDFIKKINNHSFMFSDPKNARVYIETKSDMENNAVFATLGNKETELNNEITLKFGLVTNGSLIKKDDNDLVVEERNIIIDLERLNLFNAVQAPEIKFSLMSVNCLVSKTSIYGKNGSFFNLIICSTVLKN